MRRVVLRSRATWRRLAALAAVVLIPTLACAHGARRGMEGDSVRAVRAVVAAIIAADNARDLDAVLALYTPDAVLMPPGEDPVVGRAAIRPRYETLFRTMIPAIRSELTEVQVAGGWAFVRGRNTGELRPIDSAATPRRLNDHFLMVLSRDSSDQWRIARLIWHPGAPP